MANLLTTGNNDVTMVAGVIGSSGAIIRSPTSGIDSDKTKRNEKGEYTVTFTFTYKNPPTVTATIRDGEGIATVISASTSSITVRTSDTSNNRADREFSFIAVEQVSE